MQARNYFSVGFWRGLNSVAEVFAPYAGGYGGHESSPIGPTRSGWNSLREDTKSALGAAFAKISPGVSGRQLADSRRSARPVTKFVFARWRNPLPSATELEKIEKMVPGGADRLLQMAEQDLEASLQRVERELAHRIEAAEKDQAHRIEAAEKEQAYRIEAAEKDHQIAEKELARRIEDSRRGHEDFRRGQWLGWFLAAGALTAAAVVSLFHVPWQVSVALVGIPVLGAVQALIQGRKEKGARRDARWF